MTNKICKISLFSAILACVATMPSESAVKAKNGNRSYSSAYQQINAMRYEQEYANANMQLATTASATEDLPVAVDDEKLARSIANNESNAPTMSKLESCAMIYPNGVFKWAEPMSGVRKNPGAQCVAVVELRDANSNEILATTTLGAGDSMKCNIDYFPEIGYNMAALSKVELPADEVPTLKDVEAIMNEEQKQNAGLKIAAAALIGGVAGNLLGPKEAGKSSDKIPFGTGKTQLVDTAIGAVAGAGVMAASSYSGKVAGDTIKSVAVDAASGMIVGNMLAGASGGDNVLAVVKCSVDGTEHDCIAGTFNKRGEKLSKEQSDGKPVYLINISGEVLRCADGVEGKTCTSEPTKLVDITIKVDSVSNKKFDELITPGKDEDRKQMVRYEKLSDGTMRGVNGNEATNVYFEIVDAYKTTGASTRAYAVFNSDVSIKATDDWKKLAAKKPTYYGRNYDGTVSAKLDVKDGSVEFTPSNRKASDGGLVDISNQSRVKGTVAGGAVGGALGGVAAYSGAKTEISERWTTAVREYEDSLSNFVCITGGRYLSKYNDYFPIPELPKEE